MIMDKEKFSEWMDNAIANRDRGFALYGDFYRVMMKDFGYSENDYDTFHDDFNETMTYFKDWKYLSEFNKAFDTQLITNATLEKLWSSKISEKEQRENMTGMPTFLPEDFNCEDKSLASKKGTQQHEVRDVRLKNTCY